jgi:hypothetical protein
MTFQGEWSSETTYHLDDAVYYNGSSYIPIIDPNAENVPDLNPGKWALLAKQGAGTGAVQSAHDVSEMAAAAPARRRVLWCADSRSPNRRRATSSRSWKASPTTPS